MFGKLRGIIDTIEEDHIIIDVSGVGYLVYCSSYTLRQIPALGDLVTLHIETHVREDLIQLYGFLSIEEKKIYLKLTKVSGVGSKMGLAILSALSPQQIVTAVAAQDKKALTAASGVGPKLAERLIVELKDKLTAGLEFGSAQTISSSKTATSADGGMLQATHDAVSALVNLGYSRSDAFMVVNQLAAQSPDDASVDVLIREGLKKLAKA